MPTKRPTDASFPLVPEANRVDHVPTSQSRSDLRVSGVVGQSKQSLSLLLAPCELRLLNGGKGCQSLPIRG